MHLQGPVQRPSAAGGGIIVSFYLVQVSVGTCDNCGSEDESCQPVRRVYLVPEAVVLEEIEQWCAACRSQYPHAEPDGDEESSAS
jgi:hypothetical protein